MPGPDVSPRELKERSWWTGPECFVLVDDYDLVTSGSSNPLTPLLEFLPQASDIGLHLILTRRSGGASRAAFEPVIQRLRELSTPGQTTMAASKAGADLAAQGYHAQVQPADGSLALFRLDESRRAIRQQNGQLVIADSSYAPAALAKEAFKTGKTIRELCTEQNILPADVLQAALDPYSMTEPQG